MKRTVASLRIGESGWVSYAAIFQTGAPDDYSVAYHINSHYAVHDQEGDAMVRIQRIREGIEVTVPNRQMIQWPQIPVRETDWGDPLPVTGFVVAEREP